MNREIKFRAWDTTEDIMLDDVYLMNGTSDMLNEYFKYADELKFMQFTGLKDKNGIEIYEGDVLSVDSSGTALGDKFYEGFHGYNNAIVVADIRYIPFKNYTDRLTVVSNIYEK